MVFSDELARISSSTESDRFQVVGDKCFLFVNGVPHQVGEAIACPEDNAIYEEAARTSVEMVTVKTVVPSPPGPEKKEINKKIKPEDLKKPVKPTNPVKGAKKDGIWSNSMEKRSKSKSMIQFQL